MSVPTNKTISNISQYPLKTARVYFTEKGALAQDSVAAAAASATAAANSAAAAGNSAASSAGNAAAAATSAANAAAHYATFHNVYYGSFAAPPSTRPDGSARQGGDMYYQNVNISGGARAGLQVWSANDVGVFSWAPSVTTVETIDDRVFALLVPGANIGLSYNDLANTLTISSSVTSTMAGEGFRNYYDTIAKAQLSHIPPEIKAIALMGASAPGDAGTPMICERRNGPVTNHAGWIRSSDRYKLSSNPGDPEDNTNGGYWEYVSKNQAWWVEWFGAKGDYTIVNQDGSGWGINPTPTDNRQAIINASKFIWTHGGNGGLGFGGTVQFGHAQYYVSDEITIDRGIGIQGVSNGNYHDGATSKLIFAAGKKGFIIHCAGEGVNAAQGSFFRDLYIGSQGFGGQTDKHGIEMRGTISMDNCSVYGFGGDGVHIHADVQIGTNSNLFYLSHCSIYGNAVDGVSCQGGDSNAGIGIALSVMSNGRWGIYDNSYLGNSWYACHASGNGNSRTGFGGGYYASGPKPTLFSGCYSEEDQAPSYAGPRVLFECGFQGSGVICNGGSWIEGGRVVGGMNYIGTESGNVVVAGVAVRANAAFSYAVSGSSYYDWIYSPNQGFFNQINGQPLDWAYGVTPPEGATYRDPAIRPNSFMLPYGVYMGSPEAGTSQMRMLGFNLTPPGLTNTPYRQGDVAFDYLARSAGWICTADGITTASWASGTTYALYSIIRTPSGKVYQLTKIPYDPDRWSTPPVSVEPTHTSGTIMYPEPNPEQDPGEATTIPGYTYTPTAYQPIYLPWVNFVGRVYEGPGACTNTAGQSYFFTLPVAPPKIFNQTWTMPGSTVMPTHTSGAVAYPEPNPSPSGTEPATIPGYVWRYITSNPTAKWMSFGELFTDSARFQFNFTLNHGDRTAVQTVTVPGAKLGDFARATTWNPYETLASQGLLIIAWVTGDNQAKFQVHNLTGATVTLNLMDWYVRVYKGQN